MQRRNCPVLRANFGRKPFAYDLPGALNYLPLEALDTASASWFARFEHASSITRTVRFNEALSPSVTEHAIRQELGDGNLEYVYTRCLLHPCLMRPFPGTLSQDIEADYCKRQ